MIRVLYIDGSEVSTWSSAVNEIREAFHRAGKEVYVECCYFSTTVSLHALSRYDLIICRDYYEVQRIEDRKLRDDLGSCVIWSKKLGYKDTLQHVAEGTTCLYPLQFSKEGS